MHKNQSAKERSIHLANLIKWCLIEADISWGKYWLLKAIPVPQPLYPSLRDITAVFFEGQGVEEWEEGNGRVGGT